MLKKMMSVMVALSVIFGAAYTPAAFADAPTNVSQTNEGVISVNGEGIIVAKPDVAYVSIGYDAKNKDALVAQNEAKTKMAAIIKLIKAEGIKDGDIKTTNVSLYKTSDYVKEVKYDYYMASNTVEVTVRDIDSVGKLIDVAVKGGSNQLGSVRFAVENTDKYQMEALKLAIKNANNKANAMADAIGVKIGKPSRVAETNFSGGMVYREANTFSKAVQADVTTPVEVGTITIQADVNVEYKY